MTLPPSTAREFTRAEPVVQAHDQTSPGETAIVACLSSDVAARSGVAAAAPQGRRHRARVGHESG
jgi:hypothetical protein